MDVPPVILDVAKAGRPFHRVRLPERAMDNCNELLQLIVGGRFKDREGTRIDTKGSKFEIGFIRVYWCPFAVDPS
jgi:hypothetical protein